MATQTREPDLTRQQLLRILQTGNEIKGIGPMRALTVLQHKRRPNVAELFLELMTDDARLPRLRRLAALGLYRIGGERGRSALHAAAERADAVSAPAVAMGLGRIGAADSLDRINRLETRSPAHARDRVRFAATLLAYRLGLPGGEVRAPTGRSMQELGRKRARPIDVTSARRDVVALAFEALSDDPLDVDLTEENAQRITCDPNTFVWAWTRGAAGADPATLAREKRVAGVLFRQRLFENAYALSAIGLATPVRNGVRLTIHRASSGEIVYAGFVGPDGKGSLQAREHPGVAAIELAGELADGRIEISRARSAIIASPAREPTPA